ncbi:MAG TPA: hypothetical protein ENN17_01460 [bacterium]|nr:hypothetical protein [bacterium]
MKFNAWLLFGIIGVSLFGSQFGIYYGRAVWGNADIWWTPRNMALPPEDTKNEFELFVKGDLLQDHLERGSLSATDPDGESKTLNSGDIAVRLNNRHKTKASLLHVAVFMALLLGASLMSLVVGIRQMMAMTKKP